MTNRQAALLELLLCLFPIIIGFIVCLILMLFAGCGTAEDLYCDIAPERCEDPVNPEADVLIKECDTRGHAKVWQKPDGYVYSVEQVEGDLCQ